MTRSPATAGRRERPSGVGSSTASGSSLRTVFVFSALFTFGALYLIRRRNRLLLVGVDTRDLFLERSHPGRSDHVRRRGGASDAARPHLVRNMAPVFYELEADVEEVTGVPTELNRAARSTASSTSRRSRRSSTRATPTALRILRACASPRRARSTRSSSLPGCRSTGVRTVAATPEKRDLGGADEGAVAAGGARAARDGGGRDDPDRRRGAAQPAYEDPTPHYDLGRLWLERTGPAHGVRGLGRGEPVGEGLVEPERAIVASVTTRAFGAERARARRQRRPTATPRFLARYFEQLRYSFGPRERAGLSTSSSWRATSASSTRCRSCASSRKGWPRDGRREPAPSVRRCSRGRSRASGSGTTTRPRSSGRATSWRSAGPRELRGGLTDPYEGDVHRRPEPELHEHLRHRLRLLRLLPPPRRPRARRTSCRSP